MDGLICRTITNGSTPEYITEKVVDGKIIGKLNETMSRDLQEIIRTDKNFGLLKPKDGKSFAYRIMNKDGEVTYKQVREAVTSAFFRWYLELEIRYHKAGLGEDPDIKVFFRDEEEDEILDSQTLAYMFYPLGGKFDGICVVNKRFHWSNHGNGIDMHFIDPINYPKVGSGILGMTWDLDVVLTHEFGHGIFGLQHFMDMMFPKYDKTVEQLGTTDIIRGSAKVPKKTMSKRRYDRLIRWLKHSSERS